MTNLSALIKAAQSAIAASNASVDWGDVDTLSDEQLIALVGPGYPEKKAWDDSSVLPTSTAGLMLLAGSIEGYAESELNLRLRKLAGPGYPEFERWALTGQAPETEAGKRLVAAVQAADTKETQ